MCIGEYDLAIAQFNRTFTLDSQFVVAQWYLGLAFEQVGRYSDIFNVQDEITLAVVEALNVKLFGQEQVPLKHPARNPEALEFYLRGLSYFTRFTPEYFQKAIESFDQAIALDPYYASPYAGLAESYSEMSFFASPGEWMPKAKEAARKALELDDMLGNAQNPLAV